MWYVAEFPVWDMADASQPRKVFEAAYKKKACELYDLNLEEQDLRPSSAKCAEIFPGLTLSDLDSSQPLIVVFGGFVLTALLWVKSYGPLILDASIPLRSPAQSHAHPLGDGLSDENSQ